MLDNTPLDIQSEIMKRLPVKSLRQFQSVSTRWNSFIDDPEFIRDYIRNYHINHTNPQHHLLVRYMLDNVQTYNSIVDDNTFPEQRLPLIAPESLASLIRDTYTLTSDDGLLCFCGYYGDLDAGTRRAGTRRAVIWNPTVRRSVSIDIYPNETYECTVVGFGVCHGDPKLVKISVIEDFYGRPTMWAVDVFSLRTREWINVPQNEPFRLYKLECAKVCLNGVIYFRAYDIPDPGQNRSNFFISFNLESGEFGEVPFPENLVHARYVQAAKVNESLGILEYHPNDEGGMDVCTVWTWDHETFNMIYTVVVKGHSLYGDVLGFRNNGEVVVELKHNEESRIVVYVPLGPLAGHITGVGINGRRRTFSVRSYMETAHLLDHPEQHIIIH